MENFIKKRKDRNVLLEIERAQKKLPQNLGYGRSLSDLSMAKTGTSHDYVIANNGTITYTAGTNTTHRYFFEGNQNPTYTLVTNASGLVQFPDNGIGFARYGTVDAGGTDNGVAYGPGDHFLLPITAAALFGLMRRLNADHQFTVSLGDMSSSNGRDPWQAGFAHHAGHGHNGNRSGLDVDFRYLNRQGTSFQAENAFNNPNFSRENNQTLFDTARQFGFTSNFQGNSGNLNNVAREDGHNDHGHLGFVRNNATIVTTTSGSKSLSLSYEKARVSALSIPKTWDTHTDKRILELHPDIRMTVAEYINLMDTKHGMKLRVTDNPYRTFEEQDELYAQGRTKPGKKVTNARAGESYHNYGLAIDVVEIKPQFGYEKGYDQKRWSLIGKEGKAMGFEWGGDFKNLVDKPHLQMTFGYSEGQLLALVKKGALIKGTTYVQLTNKTSKGQSYYSGGLTRPTQMSANGIAFLKRCEGYRDYVYDDANPNVQNPTTWRGFLTIGHGHRLTNAEVQAYRQGTYQFQNGITAAQAETLLEGDLAWAENAVANFVTTTLAQHQFDAAVSYVYNAGTGNTLSMNFGTLINNGEFAAAALEMDIVTSGGVKKRGLFRRRNAEYDLFQNGVYGNFNTYEDTFLTFKTSVRLSSSQSFSDPFPHIKSAKFKAFLPTILKHEGGFVNNPADPGGATNKGITIATFQKYGESLLAIEPTLENLKKLTDEQAGLIYEQIYWNKLSGEDIKDVQVAYQYVDFYINAGSNAIRTMQRTLNGLGKSVAVSGIMDRDILDAINALNAEQVFNAFRSRRIQYYEHLVQKKPQMEQFLKGWKNRANSFVYSSGGMSEGRSFINAFGLNPNDYTWETYKVKAGETLWSIIRSKWNLPASDASNVKQVKELVEMVISKNGKSDSWQPGLNDAIQIPTAKKSSSVAGTSNLNPTDYNWTTYKVKANEGLWSIIRSKWNLPASDASNAKQVKELADMTISKNGKSDSWQPGLNETIQIPISKKGSSAPTPSPVKTTGGSSTLTNGWFSDSKIKIDKVKEADHGAMTPVAIVLHRTENDSTDNTVEGFKKGIAAHFVVGKDGAIIQTVGTNRIAHHVGKIRSKCEQEKSCSVDDAKIIKDLWSEKIIYGDKVHKVYKHESKKSYPNRYPFNEDSIGIEVVGAYHESTKTWDSVPTAQADSTAYLVNLLKKQLSLSNTDIYTHEQISYKTEGEGQTVYNAIKSKI
ncbi:glycosyl hydrolase 108 family protein [Fluviicola taffensis]|uniref:glycosyl hydrolase 108 family protein n=1 Tax=Fluviicola taffensis TaxID=191579 RepID=UPI003137F1F7